MVGLSTDTATRLIRGRLRPHGKLVAARLDEVKAPAAREGKDRFEDCPTSGFDLGLSVFQLHTISALPLSLRADIPALKKPPSRPSSAKAA